MTDHCIGVIDMVQATRKCSIDGCEKNVRARGWCQAHYARWRRYGSPSRGGASRTRSTSPFCQIEDCGLPVRTRGYCNLHYQRWWKHGDPSITGVYYDPEESFSARTEWQGDCLVWTGGTNTNGYGQISIEGTNFLVHRYAWEQVNGTIPDNMQIDHICHNRVCCNVEHLRLATPSQNAQNLSGARTTNKHSGVRNVHKNHNGWVAAIRKGDKLHYFGTYSTVQEAAEVAREARLDLFGEFAGNG